MDILIISNYWHFKFEKESSRYLSIANTLSGIDKNVEVVTSSFYHTAKKQRNIRGNLEEYKFKTTLIYEPGYKKNIDVNRIISHHIFAKNVIKYIEKRKKPDLIYLFVPSLSLASRVLKFANMHNIKIIIDILDLWPEAFKMLLPIPKITKYFLTPLMWKANKIYSKADVIIAVSKTYVDRAMKYNNKCKKGLVIYIGAEKNLIDSIEKMKIEKNRDEIWIVYIGTLGSSYDLNLIIRAISRLDESLREKVVFQIMGDGPLREKFEKYSKEKKINTKFWGRLDYKKMIGILKNCDIAVNPIKKGAAQSIINKVGDYAAVGLPVINTQENKEYRDLVDEYKIGFNCNNEDINEIVKKLKILIENKGLRDTFGKNNRKLFEDEFDRSRTYKKIIKEIF